MKVLFWDIDGTLLTTKRAGVFALEAAAAEIIGTPLDLSELNTAGLTDRQIAANILQLAKIKPDNTLTKQMLALYAQYLPENLPKRQGHVLEGVKAILETLQPRKDVINLLLTGNIKAGAIAKLTYYGLMDYFSEGAFADEAENRNAIATEAKSLAEKKIGKLTSDQLYVIGDTPHDIKCGQSINATVIAVATGTYTLAQLEKYHPWWAISVLPEPQVFLSKIGLYD